MDHHVTLKVRNSTKDLIMIDCLKEFLKHNKGLEDFKITQNDLIKRIATHYLECGNL